MRRLEVNSSGYWYTCLTILLGVVSLAAHNNVLYLIESLLLSGMIFSGILSERTISAVEVKFTRLPASVDARDVDRVHVRNLKRFPLFCVEVGEWKDRRFVSAAYIPKLAPRAEAVFSSEIFFPERGPYRWSGLVVATSYPFGLVKKLRIIEAPGERLVWPEMENENAARNSFQSGLRQVGGQDFAEGEIRPYAPEDDCRNIVWMLSQKGMGEFVRKRKASDDDPCVFLDLRMEPGTDFERRVKNAAQPFHRLRKAQSSGGSLTVIGDGGSRTFHGPVPALNELVGVKASGRLGKAS